MLSRFYAVCNCGAYCGATCVHRRSTPVLDPCGYLAQVDADLCVGCGVCAEICPFTAISVDHGYAAVDGVACMGCGVCVAHCPQEAITLVRDPAKGEPLEIQELMAHAAQVAER